MYSAVRQSRLTMTVIALGARVSEDGEGAKGSLAKV
jgi:hypothetical protein